MKIRARSARVFTEQEIQFVKDNHLTMPQREIGKVLDLSMHNVKRLLNENGLESGSSKHHPKRSLDENWSKQDGNRFFDVHEMEWL